MTDTPGRDVVRSRHRRRNRRGSRGRNSNQTEYQKQCVEAEADVATDAVEEQAKGRRRAVDKWFPLLASVKQSSSGAESG